ncbi:MAG: hypothetical protein V1820_02820 [archaeon]
MEFAQTFRLASFGLVGILGLALTLLRLGKVGKRRPWLSVAGIGLSLSFGFYTFAELYGLFGEPEREFIHAASFLFFWALATVNLLGCQRSTFVLPVLETGAAAAVSWLVLGEKGLFFAAIVALGVTMHFTSLYHGLLRRVNALSTALNFGVVLWMFHVFALSTGASPPVWLDILRGLIALACLFLYFRFASPQILQTRIQANALKKAFKV